MFGQLLSNKNKIAIVWRDIYYAKFGSQFWNLNEAWGVPKMKDRIMSAYIITPQKTFGCG
jgi:hypothetical protein